MGDSEGSESELAWLLQTPPGARTAGVLERLDPVAIPQAVRVDALVALDRLAAWAASVQLRVLAAMAADPCSASVAPKLDREWVSEDVRLALGDSGRGAQHRVKVATELVERLPDTLAALGEGRVNERQAVAVAEAVMPLESEVAVKIEKDVLPVREDPSVPVATMASFRRKLRRAGLRHDPRSTAQKAAQAAGDRDVWLVPQENSVSYVNALLPADGAALVMAATR